MTEPTPQLVIDLWTYMQSVYGSDVIQKADSELMKLVAGFLDVAGIQDDETFMQRFTTTLHNNIYIPFELGVVSPQGYDLWGQICICVHEHQHIEQGTREGWVQFSGQYLTSPAFRANFEAEAYGCNMELEYWRRGTSLNPKAYGQQRVEGLSSYGCNAAQIEQAKQTIALRADLLLQDGLENKCSQLAIAFLNEHAPHLCGL